MTRRLLALDSVPYWKFVAGTKTVEIRSYGGAWTERTVSPGLDLTVRRGYSTKDEFLGKAGRVVAPANLDQAPAWVHDGADLSNNSGRFFDSSKPLLCFEVQPTPAPPDPSQVLGLHPFRRLAWQSQPDLTMTTAHLGADWTLLYPRFLESTDEPSTWREVERDVVVANLPPASLVSEIRVCATKRPVPGFIIYAAQAGVEGMHKTRRATLTQTFTCLSSLVGELAGTRGQRGMLDSFHKHGMWFEDADESRNRRRMTLL